MPIRRTYQCAECFHRIEVELEAEQWDDPPPDCPRCVAYDELQEPMQQDFKPVAIGGSPHAKARAIAEDIIANDYHVADYTHDRHEGARQKVRYKDQTAAALPAEWKSLGGPSLEAAAAIGRQTRLEFGTGLDILQSNLRSGAQPDLIEMSKRRSARVW